MSQLEFSNVWKEYGDQVVLERLNLSIEAGEFCSIVGASGYTGGSYRFLFALTQAGATHAHAHDVTTQRAAFACGSIVATVQNGAVCASTEHLANLWQRNFR